MKEIIVNEKPSVKETVDYVSDLYKKQMKSEEAIRISLRGLSTEHLIGCFKYGLENPEIKDDLMILNIINLVKQGNTLSPEYFNHPDIFIQSIQQFMSIKTALSREIKSFITQLSIYFLSILKYLNKVTFTPLDEVVVIPNVFHTILLSNSIYTISGIFELSDEVHTDKLVKVQNANMYMASMCSYYIKSDFLLQDILKKYAQEDIK